MKYKDKIIKFNEIFDSDKEKEKAIIYLADYIEFMKHQNYSYIDYDAKFDDDEFENKDEDINNEEYEKIRYKFGKKFKLDKVFNVELCGQKFELVGYMEESE